MMPDDQFVLRVGMLLEDAVQPGSLNVAFTTQASPQRMHENQQQVVAPYPV